MATHTEANSEESTTGGVEKRDPEAEPTSNRSGPIRRVVYRSAVDLWLAVLLAAPIVIGVAIGAMLIAMSRPGDASWMFLVSAILLAVTAVFTVPCRYTMLEDTLSIRCGLFCFQVPYASIVGMEKSRTLRSGAAMSLSRIVIHTDRRDHIVSPIDRDRFMQDLQRRIDALGLSGC